MATNLLNNCHFDLTKITNIYFGVDILGQGYGNIQFPLDYNTVTGSSDSVISYTYWDNNFNVITIGSQDIMVYEIYCDGTNVKFTEELVINEKGRNYLKTISIGLQKNDALSALQIENLFMAVNGPYFGFYTVNKGIFAILKDENEQYLIVGYDNPLQMDTINDFINEEQNEITLVFRSTSVSRSRELRYYLLITPSRTPTPSITPTSTPSPSFTPSISVTETPQPSVTRPASLPALYLKHLCELNGNNNDRIRMDYEMVQWNIGQAYHVLSANTVNQSGTLSGTFGQNGQTAIIGKTDFTFYMQYVRVDNTDPDEYNINKIHFEVWLNGSLVHYDYQDVDIDITTTPVLLSRSCSISSITSTDILVFVWHGHITSPRTLPPSPTPTYSVSSSINATPSLTPSQTPSITPTISVTPSISISSSTTPSITPSRTPSISISASRTPSRTPTITPTPSPSMIIYNMGTSPVEINSGNPHAWKIPTGVTSINVSCFGPGGNGKSGCGTLGCRNYPGGGGGAGAYAKKTISVVPGEIYFLYVPGNGVQEPTRITNYTGETLCSADYGRQAVSNVGGAGGLVSNCIGDEFYAGGSGGTGGLSYYYGGGGGGGRAGNLSVGLPGVSTNSAAGGDGGAGGSGTTYLYAGGPGGHGGGASSQGFPGSGGGGAGGYPGTGSHTSAGGLGVHGTIIVSF